MKVFYCIFLVAFGVSFMSGCAQINRDNLRYGAIKRGTEVYRVNNMDSLESAKEHNREAVELYRKHVEISRGQVISETFKEIKNRVSNMLEQKLKECNQTDNCNELQKLKDEINSITVIFNEAQTLKDEQLMSLAKGRLLAIETKIRMLSAKLTSKQYLSETILKIPPTQNGFQRKPEIEIIWPKDFINNVVDKDKGDSVNELLRALSSTASVAQMRDLLTEPSFPPMLPVERTIELGCLPPPDSAAFEAVMNLSANLKNLMVSGAPIDASLSANFATSVVKLFEESERTLFLQYALFRLCEMSVNSPAEFRNVYPVIIHDIVRRTAEMTQLANQKAEERRIEEEKTKQMELSLEMQKTKPDKESLYNSCIKAKLNAGLSDNEKIVAECKTLVNSKPE